MNNIIDTAPQSAANDRIAFLANFSHEIRTPMNAIIGMTEIAKTTDDPQKVAECIDKINAASKHLLRIVNDAMEISKISFNKFTLYEEPFLFDDMIQNISSLSASRAKERSQRFSVTADSNIPRVLIADEIRLTQVINNLLGNAHKCAPDGGRAGLSIDLVSFENQSARLRFTVSDDGGGGAALKRELLSTSAQNDTDFVQNFNETGLSISVSQGIVALMGGVIRVADIPGGSAFAFEIDVRVSVDQPENDGRQAEPSAGHDSYDFSGYTVLLVEDVEINREVVLALLENTGVHIECAENGQIAVQRYAADPDRYNMIYMDIQMPVLDGYAAAQKIRLIDATVPIVAMTADAFADDIQKCKRHGMDDHIAKPLDIGELLKKTDRYIRRKD